MSIYRVATWGRVLVGDFLNDAVSRYAVRTERRYPAEFYGANQLEFQLDALGVQIFHRRGQHQFIRWLSPSLALMGSSSTASRRHLHCALRQN